MVDRVPADAATLTVLGNAYMADGKPDLALQQFEKAAALDPENPAIKTRVGISEIDFGQGQQGLATSSRCLPPRAGASVAGPTLVLTELRAKRLDKAAEVAGSLIKETRRTRSTTLSWASSALRSGTILRPRVRFAPRLRSTPNFLPPRAIWRSSMLATGRVDEAKKVYTDVLAKNATMSVPFSV